MNMYSPMSVSPPQCVRSFGYTFIPCVGFSGFPPVFFLVWSNRNIWSQILANRPASYLVIFIAVYKLASLTDRTFVSPFPECLNVIFGWQPFNQIPDPCVRYRSLLLLCRRQGCTGCAQDYTDLSDFEAIFQFGRFLLYYYFAVPQQYKSLINIMFLFELQSSPGSYGSKWPPGKNSKIWRKITLLSFFWAGWIPILDGWTGGCEPPPAP